MRGTLSMRHTSVVQDNLRPSLAGYVNPREENHGDQQTGALGVEVYKDIARPSAQAVGDTLGSVAQLVLRPLQFLVDKGHAGLDRLFESVDRRLVDVPIDQRVEPAAYVAGPLLLSAALVADQTELREMYAKLLASAINVRTATDIHPSFVGIISQLTADEAKLVAAFTSRSIFPGVRLAISPNGFGEASNAANTVRVIDPWFSTITSPTNFTYPERLGSYVNNVVRLGLVHEGTWTSDRLVNGSLTECAESAAQLMNDPRFGGLGTNDERARIEGEVRIVLGDFELRPMEWLNTKFWWVELTDFGKRFVTACVDAPI
jgi:hypothetical protein